MSVEIHVHAMKLNAIIIEPNFGCSLPTRRLSSLPLEGTDISSLHSDMLQMSMSPISMVTKVKRNGHMLSEYPSSVMLSLLYVK